MECFSPRSIRLPDGRSQIVRCGKCLACLSHRQAEWTTRLRVELEASPDSCYFVTLTYNDQSLPRVEDRSVDLSEVDEFPLVPTVLKSDLQKFHADLRKRFQQGFFRDFSLVRAGFRSAPERITLPYCQFKFYCTSEYGPLRSRPHYHGFYIGLPEDADLTYCLFSETWAKGFVYCEKASSEKCAAYVAKYLVNESLVPRHEASAKPFSLMSKGLGKSYLDNSSIVDWHRSDPRSRNYAPHQGSKQILPRYLRDKIFDDEMKAVVLDDCVKRDEAHERYLASLPLKEYEAYLDKQKHDHAEAYRQARWRFQSRGKVK